MVNVVSAGAVAIDVVDGRILSLANGSIFAGPVFGFVSGILCVGGNTICFEVCGI